jgi:hypothetical protein
LVPVSWSDPLSVRAKSQRIRRLLKEILSNWFRRSGNARGAIENTRKLNVTEPHSVSDLETKASELSGITFYAGHAEHAYSLEFTGTNQTCPRCHASTRQHYANWIYATQVAPRVMMAPAGYFCTKCASLIIDEKMIQLGMSKQFRYQGVLGIDFGQGKPPEFFRTWNGKTAIYVFNEKQIPVGISISKPNRAASDDGPRSGKKITKKRKRRR